MLKGISLSVAFFVALPLITLGFIALNGDVSGLRHIVNYVLPKASLTTFILLLGVAVLAGGFGTICAWLVSFYKFPGRSVFMWALVLPLAIPTYLAAYTLVEYFSYTGPIQSIIRDVLGFQSARDYWFPEMRSLAGAIFILSLVLYPYVYLTTMALFKIQSRQFMEAGRLLQAGPFRIFFSILMPLVRPATIAGVSLCLMETLNDIGAVEYLGVETLTLAVFSAWINRDDLTGAAQLTLVLFLVVAALLLLERIASRNSKLYETHAGSGGAKERLEGLKGSKALIAFVVCVLPVALGFLIPIYVLAQYLSSRTYLLFEPDLYEAAWSSTWLSATAAILTTFIALILTYTLRQNKKLKWVFLTRISSIGYAIPGTILALGLFIVFAKFDNWVDGLTRTHFDFSTGLLISGSGVLIIYAYVVRFLAIAEGNLNSGFRKLTPSLDYAGQVLGRGSLNLMWTVHMPILSPAIAVAALLVFIDCMKELSATLFLRPFGLDTLATHLYQMASQARVEEGSAAALIIVAIGIVPVIFVARSLFKS